MSVVLARAGMPGQGRLFAAEGEVVMRRGWKTGYAVLLSVLLGLGGVGCTTQSSVSSPTTPVVVTPSTSTTSVTASSATPTATNDDEAAKAAVQSYVAGLTEAMVSRSTSSLRDRFWPGCLICEQDAARIDGLAKAGKTAKGGALTWSGAQIESREGTDKVVLQGQVVTSELIIYSPTGAVVDSYPSSLGNKRFLVLRRDGAWKVAGVFS